MAIFILAPLAGAIVAAIGWQFGTLAGVTASVPIGLAAGILAGWIDYHRPF